MKRNQLLLVALVGLSLVSASVFAISELRSDRAGANHAQVHTCTQKGKQHTVTIQNDQVQPKDLEVKLCDTLTIKNKDTTMRKIGFGVHEQHSSYDGVREKTIGFNSSFTITFNQTGTYLYHDHYHDEVSGTFSVSE